MTRAWCPACYHGGDEPPHENATACEQCIHRRKVELVAKLRLWDETEHVGMMPDILTVTLHTGFLSLVETPEELLILRFGVDGAKAAMEVPVDSLVPVFGVERARMVMVARSRISTTNQIIRPIDRVAARVTSFPDTERS